MDRFADCIAKGRLKKAEPDGLRVAAEVRLALEELGRARIQVRNGNWGDVVTQSYFAFYHAARAGLLSRGHVDTNFFGLCVGLEKLFVEPGDVPANALAEIREAKAWKDLVYNGGHSSLLESGQALRWAHGFTRRMLTVLDLPDFDLPKLDFSSPEPRKGPRGGQAPAKDASPE